MGIRLAIGAGRAQLIRQLLTENLLLAIPGALLGGLLAYAAAPSLVRLLPPTRDYSRFETPQLLTVVLNVFPAGTNPGPEIRPTGLIFTGVAGATPGSQDVTLGNPTAQPYSYQSGVIGNAFTYLPANASVRPNQPATMRVYPDYRSLQPGEINRGVITLLFSDGIARTINVLTVVAPSSQTASLRLGPQASGCSSPKLEIQFRSPSSEQTFSATIGKPTTLEVQVVDDCGNLIGPANAQNASVNATFSNKDADMKLTHIGNGIWTGTWRPVNNASGMFIATGRGARNAVLL